MGAAMVSPDLRMQACCDPKSPGMCSTAPQSAAPAFPLPSCPLRSRMRAALVIRHLRACLPLLRYGSLDLGGDVTAPAAVFWAGVIAMPIPVRVKPLVHEIRP